MSRSGFNFKHLLVLTALFLLNACSTTSPMKVALTELGTSSKSEYGAYDLRLIRSINITGLAPEETIGSLSVDPDKWSLIEQLRRFRLNPQDLPDILTPRLKLGDSVIYERTFCGKDIDCPKDTDIIKIKDAIELQEQNIARLADAEIELAVIKIAQAAIKQNPEDVDKLQNVLKQEYPTNNEINTANKENFAAKLSEKIVNLDANIAILKAELDKNRALINKPGIIITNWKYDNTLSAEGGIPGLNGGLGKTKDLTGYVIFTNPIVLSLQIGDDIIDKLKCPNLACSKSDNKVTNLLDSKRLYMTFYQVRAQQVLYAESLQSTLSAQLGLKLNTLIATLSPILVGVNLDSLKALNLTSDARYARYSLSANQGFLDAGKGYLQIRPFTLDNVFSVSNSCQLKECKKLESQTVPIINSRINLNKYFEKN